MGNISISMSMNNLQEMSIEEQRSTNGGWIGVALIVVVIVVLVVVAAAGAYNGYTDQKKSYN